MIINKDGKLVEDIDAQEPEEGKEGWYKDRAKDAFDKDNEEGESSWYTNLSRKREKNDMTVDLSHHRTIIRYSVDDTPFRVIVGPVGSGKSLGSGCLEIFVRALNQKPNPADNIRYVKAVVVRNTMTSLRKTTWATWKGLFGHLPGIRETSLMHHIQFPATSSGPGLDLLVEFMGLDRPQDEEKLLSLECTFMWFNEIKTIDKRIVDMASGRTGRYPSKMNGGAPATWSGIFADTNPYSSDHWLAKMENMDIEGVSIFRQPPAVLQMKKGKNGWDSIEDGHSLHVPNEDAEKWITATAGTFFAVNPEAENLVNLRKNKANDPRGKGSYYSDLIVNKELEWIQMYVQAKNVTLSDNKVVIPDFKPSIMVTREISFNPDLPLLAGMDMGSGTLWPAITFGQRSPITGGWHILDEICATETIGLTLFIEQILILLQQKYANRSSLQIFGDPAGHARDGIDMKSYFEHAQSMGLRIDPAPTNQVGMRIEAIKAPMSRMCEGRSNFLIHPRCEILINALAAKWCYRRIQVSGEASYAEQPNKLHPYSDSADSLGYLLSGGGEHLALTVRNSNMMLNGSNNSAGFCVDTQWNLFD